MTKNMNIIILSDVPPDARYTAGQVLNQAISSLAEFQFRFYWFNQSRLDTGVKLPPNCNTLAIVGTSYGRVLTFLVRACNFLLRRAPLFAKPVFAVKTALALISLLTTSVKLGLKVRRDPSRLVWFVVQGERSVIAYRIVSWIARKPYLLQQWDPLSWWMGHRQYPRRIIRMAQRLLSRLEQNALVNIVPSDAWKELLEAQGKSALRLDNFIRQPLLDEPRFLAIRDPRALHAVFVGQFYAGQELARTAEALNAVLRPIGRHLVIHLFGSSAPVHLAGSEVISHGHLQRDELIRRISKWDLALLPYPTSAGHEETARLSFPSKARVYLAAGLPILACAPAFSGVHQFLDKHYPQHYCNIEVKSRPATFVHSVLEASYEARKARYLDARSLVGREFSESAELQPLRNLLGDAA
jgi:hypothetical protein